MARTIRKNLLDHEGGEAERRLVEKEQARAEHQRPAEGEHLLLASRQRARGLAPALPEHREVAVDALHVLA